MGLPDRERHQLGGRALGHARAARPEGAPGRALQLRRPHAGRAPDLARGGCRLDRAALSARALGRAPQLPLQRPGHADGHGRHRRLRAGGAGSAAPAQRAHRRDRLARHGPLYDGRGRHPAARDDRARGRGHRPAPARARGGGAERRAGRCGGRARERRMGVPGRRSGCRGDPALRAAVARDAGAGARVRPRRHRLQDRRGGLEPARRHAQHAVLAGRHGGDPLRRRERRADARGPADAQVQLGRAGDVPRALRAFARTGRCSASTASCPSS